MTKTNAVRIHNARNAYRVYSPSDQKLAAITLEEAVRARVSLVYCLRRDDTTVKIGYTTDLAARLRKLEANAHDILCVMRGGRTQEAVIHFAFRESRVSLSGKYKHGATEHFTLTPELKDWINSCRAEMGLSPLDDKK